MSRFENSRVLITGASKGLGKSLAFAFKREGAKLALVARSGNKLEEIEKLFNINCKQTHLFLELDLLLPENVRKLTDKIANVWSGIDIIVHCIGGSFGINSTLVDWKNFSKSLEGNLGIAMQINNNLVPIMVEQGYGNIVHVGSIVSSEAKASVPYNTSKAALSGYVRSLGNKLIDQGIVITGILPGAFYGDDNAMSRYEFYKPEEYKEFVKKLPQQRMPQVEEYVPMIFLLSAKDSKIMAGSLVTMDGGQGISYYN